MLEDVLRSKISIKILSLFLENPKSEFYEKDIQKRLRISRGSIRKWITFLKNRGFVYKIQRDRFNIYRLNSENSMVKQLKILNTLSSLLPAFEKLNVEAECYLYGSAARGEDNERSDIDILILGKDRDVIEKIKSIDNRIKVSFFTLLEWAKIAKEDPAFYERVERNKIRLL
jgi:predicted nucleotidyltransferase